MQRAASTLVRRSTAGSLAPRVPALAVAGSSSTCPNLARSLSTSVAKSSSEQSWFSKLSNSLMVRKIEPSKDSHSRLLTDSQAIYELQLHDVKPGSMESYLGSLAAFVTEAQSKDPSYELVASWRVDVGDQDQVVNIWLRAMRQKQSFGSKEENTKTCNKRKIRIRDYL